MSVLEDVWAQIGGDPATLARIAEPPPTGALPSSFAVESFAAASVAAVGLAVAELTGAARVTVDPAGVADAVRSEQVVGIGDEPPENVWDPLSKVYRARDGWVRLHGNYAQHRAAIEEALGTGDPEAVAAVIHESTATGIETRIHGAGGAAAAAHTPSEWADHPHGAHVGDRPLIETVIRTDVQPTPWQPGAWSAPTAPVSPGADRRPLAGLRVLELTRVIAGPVAGRTLSWFGADVIRVESPAHAELRTLVADTGPDKRSVALDLRHADDLATLRALIAGADVVVHGLRPGALERLGLSGERRTGWSPGLIDAGLSAYGPGPWEGRRGFDSLLQLSSGLGLAEAEAAGSAEQGPRPLPCQVLDHATGLLVAAAIIRAVRARADDGFGRSINASLARTAAALAALPRAVPFAPTPPAPPRPGTVTLHGPLGTTRHAPLPITVAGVAGGWRNGPHLPGTDAPAWGLPVLDESPTA